MNFEGNINTELLLKAIFHLIIVIRMENMHEKRNIYDFFLLCDAFTELIVNLLNYIVNLQNLQKKK